MNFSFLQPGCLVGHSKWFRIKIQSFGTQTVKWQETILSLFILNQAISQHIPAQIACWIRLFSWQLQPKFDIKKIG